MNKKIGMLVVFALLVIAGMGAYLVSKKDSVEQKNQTNQANQTTPVVRVVSTDNIDPKMVVEYGKDKGIYKKHGVDVEFVTGEKSLIDILNSGQGDVLVGSIYRMIANYYATTDPQLLANVSRPFEFVGISRFSREESNKIKKVTISSVNGDFQMVAKSALKKLGINPESVEYVLVPSDLAKLEMLKKGEVDFMVSSSVKLLEQASDVEKLTVYQTSEILEEDSNILRSITSTKKIIADKKEAIGNFVVATHESIQQFSQYKNSAVTFIENKYDYSPEKAEELYASFMDASKNMDFVPSLGSVNSLAEQVKQDSKIDTQVDLAGFVFPEFANKAVSK